MTDFPNFADFAEIVESSLAPKIGLTFVEYASIVTESAWTDVLTKAKRLIMDGQVTILYNRPEFVQAHVIGDHGEYNVEFARHDPSSNYIEQWQCECPWSQYAWGRTRQFKKFEGRPCSHMMAAYWKSLGTPMDGGGGPQNPAFPPATPPSAPAGLPRHYDENTPPPAENVVDQINRYRQEVKDRIQRGELYAPGAQGPGQGEQPQQNFVVPVRPEWGDMFQPAKPEEAEPFIMQLYDVTAPPGAGVPVPPQLPVSVPGGRPPTPSNPLQFPGTLSRLKTVRSDFIFYAADDFETWVSSNLQKGITPIGAIARKGVMLEARQGKMPMPNAQPIGQTPEGIDQYRVMDLGFDPMTGTRLNADFVDADGKQGAPEQRGVWVEAQINARCEIRDIFPATREVYVGVPLRYSGPLHPSSLEGWVEYADVRPIAAPGQTPYIRRRR